MSAAPAFDDDRSVGPIGAGSEAVSVEGWVWGVWWWLCSCGAEGPVVDSRTEAIVGAYDHADRHLLDVDTCRRGSTRVRYVWPAG